MGAKESADKPWPASPQGLWSVDFANMSYEKYRENEAQSPDFVIAFNAGLHRPEYAWKPAIELLMEKRAGFDYLSHGRARTGDGCVEVIGCARPGGEHE